MSLTPSLNFLEMKSNELKLMCSKRCLFVGLFVIAFTLSMLYYLCGSSNGIAGWVVTNKHLTTHFRPLTDTGKNLNSNHGRYKTSSSVSSSRENVNRSIILSSQSRGHVSNVVRPNVSVMNGKKID